MEDILSTLNHFNVSGKPNSIHADHPRFSQFKSKHSKSSQEERRKAVLAARKIARYDLLSHVRHVEQDSQADDEDVTEQQQGLSEDMEGVVECYRKPQRYRDFLMLSEWLVDVPKDFATKYYAVPAPVGKRCLVVAANGQTSMYGRNGQCIERFYSVLPGGSSLTAHKGYSMFDCIVCYDDNIFYILDMVAWMNQSIMQCETNFRFAWVRSRLEENEYDTTVTSDNNAYKFVTVRYCAADTASLASILDCPGFEVELDGVLFYHRESHYTHGQTPLVGWLKPYMMDEILGVPVPERYASQKPKKYTTLPQHIEYSKQARQERLVRNEQTKQEARAARAAKNKDKNQAKKLNKKNAMDTNSCSDSTSCSPCASLLTAEKEADIQGTLELESEPSHGSTGNHQGGSEEAPLQ